MNNTSLFCFLCAFFWFCSYVVCANSVSRSFSLVMHNVDLTIYLFYILMLLLFGHTTTIQSYKMQWAMMLFQFRFQLSGGFTVFRVLQHSEYVCWFDTQKFRILKYWCNYLRLHWIVTIVIFDNYMFAHLNECECNLFEEYQYWS